MRVAGFAIGAVAGAIVGGAATYVTFVPGTEDAGASGFASTAPSPAGSTAPPAGATPAPMPTAERLAVYAYVTESTEPEDLEFLIQRTAALSTSHRRAFELDALLLRLAELDPRRAVRFARMLRIETERLVPLFQWWAERDAAAALQELRRLDNAAAVREIALALLDVLGDDERGVARIESVLSPAQVAAFRQDAAVRLAARDPFRALQRALALGDSTSRTEAVSRIAADWARRDPEAALALADTIEDGPLRRNYRTAVLSTWARIDPDAALAHVRANRYAGELMENLSVFMSLASADPDAVLDFADGLPADQRRVVQQFALRALAERDPYSAIAKLDAIPNKADRDQLLPMIAQAFAQRDPDGALDWVKSLQPTPPNVLMSVINGISAVDPGRAVDLVLEGELGTAQPSVVPMMLISSVLSGRQDSARLEAVADRLLASNDINATSQIGTLMSVWSRNDPDAALEWLVRNAERAGPPAVAQVASQLAANDPVAAASAIDRLPPHLQGDWLQNVAAGYAQYDPEAAAAWILQHEGRPGFTEGLAAIAPALAQVDPRAAARMIDRLDGSLSSFGAASVVASTWASSDPVAAADWALQLGDRSLRSAALNAVVSSWASQDPDGARRWVLSQPPGETRDQALQPLLPMTLARTGEVDRQLLDAFSSDPIRQSAVMSAALTLAGRDRDAARRLVDQHVTDPRVRQQTYTMIDRAGTSVSMVNRVGIAVAPQAFSVVSPGIAIDVVRPDYAEQ